MKDNKEDSEKKNSGNLFCSNSTTEILRKLEKEAYTKYLKLFQICLTTSNADLLKIYSAPFSI